MIFWNQTNEGPLSGRRLYAKIAVLLTLLLAVSLALRAQTGAAGASRLDAIEITGSARFHSEQIVPAAGLRIGANVARDFLRGHGISEAEISTVWTAIALHTTPGIPPHMHPVVALLTAGVEMDVLGLAYTEYSDVVREAVVNAHGAIPRPEGIGRKIAMPSKQG